MNDKPEIYNRVKYACDLAALLQVMPTRCGIDASDADLAVLSCKFIWSLLEGVPWSYSESIVIEMARSD